MIFLLQWFMCKLMGDGMKMFVIGTVFGLILATVGFSGIAKILDKGVETVKTQSQELAK